MDILKYKKIIKNLKLLYIFFLAISLKILEKYKWDNLSLTTTLFSAYLSITSSQNVRPGLPRNFYKSEIYELKVFDNKSGKHKTKSLFGKYPTYAKNARLIKINENVFQVSYYNTYSKKKEQILFDIREFFD